MQKHAGEIYFSVLPIVAYSIQTSVVAGLGGNIAFYTSEGANANISNTTYMLAYSLKSQTIFIVQPNIWFRESKYNLVSDIVYLKYPQETFGLGGKTALSDATLIDYSYIRLYETLLRKVGGDFFVGAGYNLDYHWNITETPTPEKTVTDYQVYGSSPRSRSSGFTLNALFDNRRNSINPQRGVYLHAIYRNNSRFLKSDANWQSLVLDARTYVRFPASSRNIVALWSYNWLTLDGKPPYLDLPSTTWDDAASSGRGYAQGRYRGRNMLYQEIEYRFGITRNGLLGGVAFLNAQTFSEYPGEQFEQTNLGYGAGVRIKVNKYSNTNLGIDYGFGVGGSQGLFVNLCEMF
jgi:hypothetical protein